MGKRLHLSRCQCGKVRFRDKREAVRSLHKIKVISGYQRANSGFTKRLECRTYECGLCKGYHLTSTAGLVV